MGFEPAIELNECKHNNYILLGLERYWYWVTGYWAIFADIG